MNNKTIKLLNERNALLRAQNGGFEPYLSETDDAIAIISVRNTLENEETETDSYVETVLVDFDFDNDVQTTFDIFMTIRYFWKDWKPIYGEVY